MEGDPLHAANLFTKCFPSAIVKSQCTPNMTHGNGQQRITTAFTNARLQPGPGAMSAPLYNRQDFRAPPPRSPAQRRSRCQPHYLQERSPRTVCFRKGMIVPLSWMMSLLFSPFGDRVWVGPGIGALPKKGTNSCGPADEEGGRVSPSRSPAPHADRACLLYARSLLPAPATTPPSCVPPSRLLTSKRQQQHPGHVSRPVTIATR